MDALGSKDFYTKIFSIGTRSFIGNEKLRGGFVKFLRHFRDKGITLDRKKHIRPAMVELNQVGGALVLDSLTENEVAAIMIEHVEKFFSERKAVDDLTPAQVETKQPVVDIGKTVKSNSLIKVISLDNKTQRKYKLSSKFKKDFPDIFDKLIGKKINSVVTLRDGKFKITEIG